jgi:hypothetical protein
VPLATVNSHRKILPAFARLSWQKRTVWNYRQEIPIKRYWEKDFDFSKFRANGKK